MIVPRETWPQQPATGPYDTPQAPTGWEGLPSISELAHSDVARELDIATLSALATLSVDNLRTLAVDCVIEALLADPEPPSIHSITEYAALLAAAGRDDLAAVVRQSWSYSTPPSYRAIAVAVEAVR